MTSVRGSISVTHTTPPRSSRSSPDGGLGLGRQLGRVRGAGQQHDLGPLVEVQRGPQQVRHPLLAGDPADEHDRRSRAGRCQGARRRRSPIWPVQLDVDPVVDDVDERRIEGRVGSQHVDLGAPLTAMMASAAS